MLLIAGARSRVLLESGVEVHETYELPAAKAASDRAHDGGADKKRTDALH
jgi:hypothetical protein